MCVKSMKIIELLTTFHQYNETRFHKDEKWDCFINLRFSNGVCFITCTVVGRIFYILSYVYFAWKKNAKKRELLWGKVILNFPRAETRLPLRDVFFGVFLPFVRFRPHPLCLFGFSFYFSRSFLSVATIFVLFWKREKCETY
jgi:hypothetical protein